MELTGSDVADDLGVKENDWELTLLRWSHKFSVLFYRCKSVLLQVEIKRCLCYAAYQRTVSKSGKKMSKTHAFDIRKGELYTQSSLLLYTREHMPVILVRSTGVIAGT